VAGVSNQPNIKPLIDKQTQVQTVEFKQVEQLVKGVSNNVDAIKSHTYAARVSTADIKDIVNLEFAALTVLLSSEIDSNGDLTVANLASFKTAVVDEVQNSQSALNFTISTSADAVLEKIATTATSATSATTDSIALSKTAITSAISGAKTAVLTEVNSAKTAVLTGVNSAKTAVLTGITSSRASTLSTVSGYITTAKNAIAGLITASENRINANINAKASGIKRIQRGAVFLGPGVGGFAIISSINLSKSMLVTSGSAGSYGHIESATRLIFKQPQSRSLQASDSGYIYWQVIEYV